MNLYKISQSVNNGWDTYDSAVVAAESESDAKTIQPGEIQTPSNSWYLARAWCDPVNVKCELLGLAKEGTPRGVICASFNAG